MLYSEIIAVCSQIHTKHINTLCGQNVEIVNVKRCGTYSDHWTLKGWWSTINNYLPCKRSSVNTLLFDYLLCHLFVLSLLSKCTAQWAVVKTHVLSCCSPVLVSNSLYRSYAFKGGLTLTFKGWKCVDATNNNLLMNVRNTSNCASVTLPYW
jgi:hypothetical protein